MGVPGRAKSAALLTSLSSICASSSGTPTMGSGVAVVQTADNQLKLEVPSDISFAVGRADLNPRLQKQGPAQPSPV